MTLYDFIAMDEMEQAEAVWSGVHIGDREDEKHKILLYQINGDESFYVEVFYNKEFNVIWKFNPFKSMEYLNVYSDQIDIEKLLK